MKLATINNPALNAAYGTPGGSGGAPGRIEALLTILLGVITVFGFVYFIFQIFIGAIQWITAGADKDAVQRAQKRFMNSVVGLVVLLLAYSLIGLVGKLLGVDLFDFTGTINKII